MNARRWILLGALGLGAVLSAGLWRSYTVEIGAITGRLAAGSQVMALSQGRIEYAQSGTGPAVLALHGAGGGYDQGLLLAGTLGGGDMGWIAVSRFGYLRSELPRDASTAAQADALAELLDRLGIDSVAVLAMSGGVPPALQFAARHPDRARALVLLSSAPYTPLPTQAGDLPVPIWVYNLLFSSDFPIWAIGKAARPMLEPMFDVTAALKARMTPPEAEFVDRMIASFLPVTARLSGLRNEGAALDPDARYALGEIAAPTLVIHARDDALNPVAIAEYTAAHVPHATLRLFEDGGHLLLTHHAEIRAAVGAFLRRHGGRVSG